MKYPCNLIRDILPLYHDQTVSSETAGIVEEHLKECGGCREYYQKMCESDVIEPVAYDEEMAMKAADSYKKMHQKMVKKIGKIIGVTALVVAGILLVLFAAFVGYFGISAEQSKETYTDIGEYNSYRSGENALDHFTKRGMDEIWPEKITDDMEVKDYLMMYYNPWDANYLGYLVVQYEEADYEEEVAHLQAYPSTDYVGTYGAMGFETYDVAAMESGLDGFVYALADGKDTIIYVEMIFPGYGMDIEYETYIPEEYLPEGLDATADNPTRQEVIERNEKKRK